MVFFLPLQDFRVVVRIDSWESTSVYPNGHFVRVLGRIGDLEAEIATILVENSISVVPFSEAQVRFPQVLCSGERHFLSAFVVVCFAKKEKSLYYVTTHCLKPQMIEKSHSFLPCLDQTEVSSKCNLSFLQIHNS